MPTEPAGNVIVAIAPVQAHSRALRAFTRPRARQPWWLWPHLFSLDAPLVAVAWQDWWSRAGGGRLEFSQRVILGLGVWMIYLADRLADTARDLPDDPATARHAFADLRRGPLLILTVLIALALALLAPTTMPRGQFGLGLVLLAGAGGYFWLIHRRGWQGWTAVLPKEGVVGAVFALGTAFSAMCRPMWPTWELAAAVVLFGVACFLNCALITSWERNACDRLDPFSFLNAFPRLAARGLRRLCWGLAGVAGVAAWTMHATIFLPLALSAFLLGVLDRWQHRFSRDALRASVDAALLTPWIWWTFSPR